MKKLLQFMPLLILPVAFILMSYSSGSPGGRSGSPGDGGNSCVQCHSSFPTISVTDWITSDIPAGGYELSEVYNITMTGIHEGVSKFGFEFTAEDSEGNKVGTLSILNPTETQLTNGTVAATHTSQGTTPIGDSKSWTVEWTAPDDPAGDVTFYASLNAANGNGSTSGDQIYLGSLTVGEVGSGGGASDLFFSEYAEGSSYNKYVEIYNGTGTAVDLSIYEVKIASNGNAWGNTQALSGDLADGDVFILAHASASTEILALANITNSSVINFNGDDAMGLFKDGILIDAIGVENEDPGSYWPVAGVSNGTQNHTLVRKPDVCEPTTDWALSAGTNADDSQWIVNPQNYWDNLGFHISNCQGGQIVATPEFSEPGGTYTEPISVSITCATAGADIYYTTDGTDPDENSTPYLLPISISETTTLKARAYADGFDPSFIATAVYNFPETVSTLAELRNGTIGNTYLLTGEVWLTYQQSFRGQKYIQDATAGILIDDDAGIITTVYQIGDGIQGISGTLGEYDGMMQFVPDTDPGDPVSSGNFPTPQVVTLDELFTNFEDYESELVQVNDITFTDGGGTFDNGQIYPISDASKADANFRSTFWYVDYIGTTIPDIALDIVGLPNAYDNENYITSRNLNDFLLGNIVATPYFEPEGGQYENPVMVEILCDTDDAEIYYTTDGTDPDQSSTLFIDPFEISETTTVKARAYKEGFDPSLIGTAQYYFAETVATLAELRAGVIGNTYTLDGEVWITFMQSYRNQKFVQDETAAILIDDNDGILNSDLEIGDGITGLSGVLDEYNGMLQFVPDADPGDPTSSGNFPEPQLVTINELFANFEDYEAELVKIESATFADAGGTFSTGTVYPISDDSKANGNFRTSFYDADYIGSDIPAAPTDIIGLPNAVYNENYITARSDADLIVNQVPPEIVVQTPNGGETWQQTKTYTIEWLNLNFAGNVNINLLRGAFTNIALAQDIPNTGSWSWTIPESITPAADWKIRVAGVTAGDPFDNSDDVFEIIEPLPDPDIVINEIMYDPPESGTDSLEYIELYNNSGFDVEISGWSFSEGVSYTFEEGQMILNDEYLVIAGNASAVSNTYGITGVLQWTSGGLSNGGEDIILINELGVEMDMVDYDDSPPWPTEPDGNGPSLELIDPNLDNSLPESWMGSIEPNPNGTPGAVNSVFGAEFITLVAPNGGETFEQGSSQEVSWTYSGFDGDLKIGIIDVVLEDTTTLAENVPVEFGLWDWEVPGDFTTGDNYKILISEMTDGEPMDESDAVFSVVEQIIPVITVTAPNGGESWTQGTSRNITWVSEFVTVDVKVELSDGTDAIILLEDSIPVANGLFVWEIPADQTAGDTYSVIVSTMDGVVSDISDAPFSIVEPEPVPELVINEIMYNTPGLDNEWCEIYNPGTETINLEGFYLLDSDDDHTPVVFPAGYSIAPGQYFTISLELLNPPLAFVPDFEGIAEWALNNGGDELRLFHSSAQLINAVAYDDGGDWPSEPDGNGPSLSLLEPILDNSLGENWAGSLQDNGTPGSENFPTTPTITVVTPNGGESIQQGTTYDITWTYANYDGTVKVELITPDKAATTLGYAALADMMFAWMVSEDTGDSYTVMVSDSLTGDPMDESDAPFSIVPPAELPDIVINEIMYNAPESGTDSLEFIELYNNGAEIVNLENWYFSQGVDFTFPNYELAAGDYVVVAYNADVMLNNFGVTALEWTGGGLSNGGEDIELRNATDDVVDYVDYDDGGFWPNAPDEYGPSLALADPASDNELPENWKPETVFAFDHVVGIPVYASPGAMNFSTPGQGILVSSGWTGVSTYNDLDNPAVEQNMSSVVDDLVVMQDFANIYYPAFNINTILTWQPDNGYQLKMDATRYLVLYGTVSADQTVDLTAGWNSLPVLSDCDVEAATLFTDVTEVEFVKEMGGDKIWWPGGSLFTLDFLEPGKAYYIKVSADVSITFPACTSKSGFEISETSFINHTTWNDASPTAVSHAIGIEATALEQFNKGDVIGAFTQEGFCAGMVQVNHESATLMVWGDDIYTNTADGLSEDENIIFRFFDAATGEVVELVPELDARFENSGQFKTHGISYIIGFKAGATGINELQAISEIYPNPTSGLLNISVDADAFDRMEVYSAIGRKVMEKNITESQMVINLKNLDNGYYFIKFVNSVSGEFESNNFIKQ